MMKRSRGEEPGGPAETFPRDVHHPSPALPIQAESMQDLQRWLVRNWSSEDGRISKNLVAVERLWDHGEPLRLLKKDQGLSSWKELEIVALSPQTALDNGQNGKNSRAFCALIRDVTQLRTELVCFLALV
jgi:hypothetical protein